MNFIKAIEKPFNGQSITFYKDGEITEPENEELWVTGEQLGQALGYAYPGKAINNLYNRNKDFLNPFSGTLNLRTPGGKQDIRVFNETGAHIIAVKANTKQSEAYILWLNELARAYRRGNQVLTRSMEKLPHTTSVFPFLPNTGQMRELRIILGREKAAELIIEIVNYLLGRRYLTRDLQPHEKLREAIKRKGLTLTKIAEITKLSIQSLSRYVQGDFPKKENRQAIAEALGISEWQIWGEE